MEDLESIWKRPIYLPYLQPKLTNEMVMQAEAQLGYRLPSKLIQILKIQNGGYIRKSLEECMNEQIYGIGPNFPSLLNVDWEEYKEWVSFQLDGLIPFDGDGHWYLCLDYRKTPENPRITYIDTESDNESLIADSFEEYLSKLKVETNDEFVIESEDGLESLINKLQYSLKITFETPDAWAHGYPTYRSKIKDSWIWVSPNKVPKGFVREDEDRYDELKEQAKGNALRYPEILEDGIFISFSDNEVGFDSVEILKKDSFKVKSINGLID